MRARSLNVVTAMRLSKKRTLVPIGALLSLARALLIAAPLGCGEDDKKPLTIVPNGGQTSTLGNKCSYDEDCDENKKEVCFRTAFTTTSGKVCCKQACAECQVCNKKGECVSPKTNDTAEKATAAGACKASPAPDCKKNICTKGQPDCKPSLDKAPDKTRCKKLVCDTVSGKYESLDGQCTAGVCQVPDPRKSTNAKKDCEGYLRCNSACNGAIACVEKLAEGMPAASKAICLLTSCKDNTECQPAGAKDLTDPAAQTVYQRGLCSLKSGKAECLKNGDTTKIFAASVLDYQMNLGRIESEQVDVLVLVGTILVPTPPPAFP